MMDKHEIYMEKLINLFDIAAIPESFIKKLEPGTIEFLCATRNYNIAGKVAEISVLYPDMHRKVFVLYDYGYCINFKEVLINKFTDMEGRNKEIDRLYHESGLSQVFIAHLFKLRQPTVSLILNRKKNS
jgi:hypothetical protein